MGAEMQGAISTVVTMVACYPKDGQHLPQESELGYNVEAKDLLLQTCCSCC